MNRTLSAALVAAVVAFVLPAPAAAIVIARFVPQGVAGGTLVVTSDGDDDITAICSAGFVLVNGVAPQTGPVSCASVNRVNVTGGPGDNRIDLSELVPSQTPGTSRGVAAYADASAGAGDDVVIGPADAIVRLEGGRGDDRLAGGGRLDRYVFGPAATNEVDTVVEPGSARCEPSFFESNQPGLTYWTVPWDALDFASLASDDPVTADSAAPAGILARHRNRTIRLGGPRRGIAIEAIGGGAGDDVLAHGCMVVGNGGDDRLTGTPGDGDLLLGGSGDDRLAGGGGPDLLNGGAGVDALVGGSGADALAGGQSSDSLAGGDGGDVYLFDPSDGSQSDRIVERAGSGVDALSLAFPREHPVTANLAGTPMVASAGSTRVLAAPVAARNLEGLIGGAGDDRLVGHAGVNHFWGGGGTDLVAGGRGDDTYHLDWLASMPYGAYGYWEDPWGGPFDRGRVPGREWLGFDRSAPSILRVREGVRGGRDTLDLAERFFSYRVGATRLDGLLTAGVRVDLSAPWLVFAARAAALVARPGPRGQVENVRGTLGGDTIVGTSAPNVLEGRQGRDTVIAGGGRDTCIVQTRGADALRSCERVRRADPDR